VNGFKNLNDLDISFGPFTCLAGPNGAGKSNILDVIRLLNGLAEGSVQEAFAQIRPNGAPGNDASLLFNCSGGKSTDEIEISVDFITEIPGKPNRRSSFTAVEGLALRYFVKLALRNDEAKEGRYPAVIVAERLSVIEPLILFPYENEWLRPFADGTSIERALASSDTGKYANPVAEEVRVVFDKGHNVDTAIENDLGEYDILLGSGLATDGSAIPNYANRSLLHYGASLSRIGQAHRAAYREIASWKTFLFEATSLRKPAELGEKELSASGENLPSLFLDLESRKHSDLPDPIAAIEGWLFRLGVEIDKVRAEVDPVRSLIFLRAVDRNGANLDARIMSDGTLRFLAMAGIQVQNRPGVFCFEQPEDGLHPQRLLDCLDLLTSIAVDPLYVGEGNPLRQVIITTHSPILVGAVPDDSLLFVQNLSRTRDGLRVSEAVIKTLPNTWRDVFRDERSPTISRGELATYLHPNIQEGEHRVADRIRGTIV